LIAIASNGLLVADVSGSNTVSGVITHDTTWTKANSPYYLSGQVTIDAGVTLTIEPGVHVIGNTWSYIDVNGTLRAVGTKDDLIQFYSSLIDFMPSSSSWNQQTSSGCIIEYAVLGSINMLYSSPKISYSSIGSIIHIDGGSPVISFNAIHSNVINDGVIDIAGDSPVIYNNEIVGQIYVEYGSPQICNNSFTSYSYTYDPYSQQRFDHPLLVEYPDIRLVNESITGIILGGTNGVRLEGWKWPYKSGYVYDAYIADNTIVASHNCLWGLGFGVWAGPEGTVKLERNRIYNCTTGIYIGGSANAQSNTIERNDVGLLINSSKQVIFNQNNIVNNNRTVTSISQGVYDLTSNWWGTTNTQTVNQLIYRSQNRGTLNFEPFLVSINSDALPRTQQSAVVYLEPDAPSPTSTLAPSVSPTNQPASTDPTPQNTPTESSGIQTNKSWLSTDTDLLILLGIVVIIVLLLVLIGLTVQNKN
jgi:hypothetical protein